MFAIASVSRVDETGRDAERRPGVSAAIAAQHAPQRQQQRQHQHGDQQRATRQARIHAWLRPRLLDAASRPAGRERPATREHAVLVLVRLPRLSRAPCGARRPLPRPAGRAAGRVRARRRSAAVSALRRGEMARAVGRAARARAVHAPRPVNGRPTRYMPWCSSGTIIVSSVDSWPPCRDAGRREDRRPACGRARRSATARSFRRGST